MSSAMRLLTSEFNTTLGAYMIFSEVTFMLFGVSLAQAVVYFRRYGDDKAIFKYMVSAVLLLEVFHIALIIHAIYEDIIIHHGDPKSILIPTWSMALLPVSVAAVDLTVRIFFSFRIWQFSKSVFIPAFLVILSFCPMGISIYDIFVIMSVSRWTDFASKSWSLFTSLGVMIFADGIIASCMVLQLRQRQAVIYTASSTSNILNTLMMYSISTGIITVVLFTMCLILFGVMPDNFIWQGLFAATPQVFANSMLVALNARQRLRNKRRIENEAYGGFVLPDHVGVEVHELVEITKLS